MKKTFIDSVATLVTKVDKGEFLRTRLVARMNVWDNLQKQEMGKRCFCHKDHK